MGSLTKVDLEVEASSNVDLLREVVAAWEDIVERILSTEGEANRYVLTDEVFHTDVHAKSDGICVKCAGVERSPLSGHSDERNPLGVVDRPVVFGEETKAEVIVAVRSLNTTDETNFPLVLYKPTVGKLEVVVEVVSVVEATGDTEFLGALQQALEEGCRRR